MVGQPRRCSISAVHRGWTPQSLGHSRCSWPHLGVPVGVVGVHAPHGGLATDHKLPLRGCDRHVGEHFVLVHGLPRDVGTPRVEACSEARRNTVSMLGAGRGDNKADAEAKGRHSHSKRCVLHDTDECVCNAAAYAPQFRYHAFELLKIAR